MLNDTTSPRHPDTYDGSMRELDMREVDRQWNQWITAGTQVRKHNRRRFFGSRFLFVAGAFGRGGHLSPRMTARLVAIEDAITSKTAITRETVTIELSGVRKPMSLDEWMARLEDEENAAAIREQAQAGEGSQTTDEWELAAA